MQTKRVILIFLLIFAAAAALWFVLRAQPNGAATDPEPPPPDNGDSNAGTSSAMYKDLIRVETPLPESSIASPLVIEGEARGGWYFEATFPVVLADWDGRIIAEGYAQAQEEWMTEAYVPFQATLTFQADTSVSNRGSLILQKANPSGLPEHDDAFEYTVYFEE